MTARIYRLYKNGIQDEVFYEYSIVASETGASFVIASDHSEARALATQERIDDLASRFAPEELPTTPDDWAIFASYNLGLSLFPVEGYEAEEIEDLLEIEQAYAEHMAEKYEYMNHRSVR